MAPVASKRKKALPPLDERLVEVQKQIDRVSSKPTELCSCLRHILDVDGAWPYDKGDLLHWANVLDVLDVVLAKTDSPDELLVVVLKFTRLLLENSSNRHVYNSYEHLKKVLEHDNCEVVMAVLHVLAVLATPRSTRQVVCEPPFIAKLTALSSIFAGAADGPLSLSACCSDAPSAEVIANGTSVKLQFYRTLDADPAKASESEEGAATVLLHNVHQMPGTDEEVYAGVMRDHRVPPESEFSLRSKLRLARSFPISERRLQWVRVQVTAMTVLANCHAAYNAGQVPVNEAQLSELMGLLHPEGSEVGDGSLPLDLQTLALKALTTLLSERSRATAALLSSAAAAHHGILASLMRKAKVQVNDVESPMLADRLKFGEAMLAFTWMFASTSTGSNALNSAGIMNFILPIVQECDARRVRFTIFAVKTLEVLMNYSPEMQQTFRDGDGLNILVERAHAESFALIRNNQNPEMDTDGKPSGAEAKAAEDTMVQDADACFRPFIVKQDGDDEKFERGKLLSQLMHLMASAGTPIATSGDVRELMQARKKLPRMLHHIFVNSEKFGPNVFEKAAALLTEFVHQEPSCLQHVIDDKVAEAILRTISNSDDQRLPISRGTVTIVPTVIGALCLTPSGTQIVDQMTPIDKFLRCLASEKVVPLLVGETPTQLGAQLEELMRHNPPLLNPCITGCVQIANRIFEICDELASSSGNEMMQETGGSSCPEPEAGADNPLLRSLLCRRASAEKAQAYLMSAIEFLGKLLDPLMSVAEHSRAFVRNKGLAAMMKLINRPEIPRDFTVSEAGRFFVLVVGRTASHTPGLVLEEVMQRTQELLESTRAAYSAEVGASSAPKPKVNEKEMRSLELHLTLLGGIVSCLRGSSAATEWDDERGKQMIDSMAVCYGLLRASAFASPAMSEGFVAASDAGGSGASAGDGVGQSRDPAADVANDMDADMLDVVPLSGATDAASKSDLRAVVASAIEQLLIRLCASTGNPARRRHDERNAPSHAHEKALATTLAASFKRLLAVEIIPEGDVGTFSRSVNGALETMSLCFFGNQAVPLLVGDSLRHNLRGGVNMLLLQVYEQSADGVDSITQVIARLVAAVLDGQSAETRAGSLRDARTQERIVRTLLRCFAFCRKLLETPLTSVGRNGQVVPLPGFDSLQFNAGLKNKLFTAIEPMWKTTSPAHWSASVAPALFEMLLLLMKPNVSEAAEGPAPAPAPAANAAPAFTHDPATVASLMEMGFPEARVHAALDGVHSNNVELATEWLFSHADVGDDEESSLAAAIALSMNSSSAQPSTLLLQIQDMMSTAAPASGALLANSLGSVSESAPTGAEAKEPAAEEAVVDPKDVCSKNADFITSKALEWGLQVLCAGNKVEFAVVDIMSWICKSKEEECKKVITSLLEAIRGASEKETDDRIKVKEADGNDGKVRAHGALPVEIIDSLSLHFKPDVWARSLMGLLRVLAILVNESVDCCRVAYEQDAFGVITKLLYVKGNAAVSDESAKSAADKTQGEEEEQSQAEPASGSQEQSSNSMAKLVGILKAHEKEAEANQWLCSSLLILNKILIHNEHAKVAESVLDREMYEKEQARLAVRKEAEERAKREEEMMSSDNEQQVERHEISRLLARAKTPQPPAAAKDGEDAASTAQLGMAPSGEETAAHSGDADAVQEMLAKNAELLRFCMRRIDGKADNHLLHAIMDICARLTRRHELALIFLHEGGLEKVLNLSESSAFSGQAIVTGSLIRHVLEDPASLQASMQSEIRSLLSNVNVRDGRHMPVRNFLSLCACMIQRDPEIFMRSVSASCRIISDDRRGKVVALLDRKEEKGPTGPAEGVHSDSILIDQSVDKSLGAPDTTPARAASAGGKSKAHGKKGLEAMSHVTSLLLNRLLSDPRIPTKSADCLNAAAPRAQDAAPSATAASAATETMQVDPPDEAVTVIGKPAVSGDMPAISPVNLLRYLADLVKFFPGCAHFVIKYTLDGPDGASKGEASKRPQEKETFVHFLLCQLVPNRGAESGAHTHQVDLSRRATNLVLALLSRSNEVRKRVMAEIVSVLNAPPKARVTVHLQMLQSLAAVLFTFLTAKVSSGNPQEVAPETVRQFFDSKVPSALCAAIASIDLHHPSASKVGSMLLRPLDVLCANSSLPDPKSSQSRPTEAQASGAGRAGASPRRGPAEGDGVEGPGDQEMSADLSMVALRSELDDSGTPARDSMLMALSMQEDDEDARGRQDEDMQDQGSVNDDTRGSDEEDDDEGSDEDDDDDEGEESGGESGAEIETEGSQHDDDEHDSQIQDEAWEEVIDDGEYDEDQMSLFPAGIAGNLAAAGFMGPEVDFDGDRELIHVLQHHHTHLPSRHDLDGILEQLMEGDPHGASLREDMDIMRENMDMMDGFDLMPDDMRDNPLPHQVLSLLMPASGGHGGNARILQNLQVIRLPSGRSGRDRGQGEDQQSPAALHEVPAAEHPLLARAGANARAQAASHVGNADVLAGLESLSRHVRRELEAPMIFAQPGVLNPRGFFLGDPGHPAMPPGFGREDAAGGGAANRWSDDGGAASSSMRTVAQQMEDRLVRALTSAEPATAHVPRIEDQRVNNRQIMDAIEEQLAELQAQPAATGSSAASQAAPPQSQVEDSSSARGGNDATAAAQPPVAAGTDAAGSAAANDGARSTSMELETASQPPAAAVQSAYQQAMGRASAIQAIADAMAAVEQAEQQAASSTTADSSGVGLGQPQATAQPETTSTATPAAANVQQPLHLPPAEGDAMDEDEDELEAALRMSLEAAEAAAPGAAGGDGAAAAAAASREVPAAASGAAGADAAAAGAAAPPAGSQDAGESASGAGAAAQVSAEAGIDPAFLAELPEDLRAEVMAQQARQNAAASLAASSSSAIDPEFLAALPPEIQADVIRQHQREEAAAAAAQRAEADDTAANRSEEMDNASFIASLAPDLREEVLITSNEAFLATLPPHLVAEAHLLRERHISQDMANVGHARYGGHPAHMSRRHPMAAPRLLDAQPGRASAAQPATSLIKRQVIEQGSVKQILRLLFVSQPVVKGLMNKMLLHMTMHSSSLEATLRFLLSSVLQACGAGERPPEIYGCSCSGNLSDGSIAVLQAKRALEALCHVAIHQPKVCNRLLREGFLSECEVQRFLTQQAGEDKSKGKQKMEALTPCTPFSLLISLLASSIIAKSTVLQEQVLQVLNYALQPVAKKETTTAAAASGAASAEAGSITARMRELHRQRDELASIRRRVESAEAGAASGASDKGAAASAGQTESHEAAKLPERCYPRVGMQDLTCLTSTLAASGNSTKIMERSTSLLKTLSNDPVNLDACTSHLVAEVKAEAELSRVGLESLMRELQASKDRDLSNLASLSSNNKHDVRLLRMVKTLRALWPVKDEESSEKSRDKSCQKSTSQPLADVVRLDDLWDLLCRCLSLLEKDSAKPAAGGGSAAGGSAASAAAGGASAAASHAAAGDGVPVVHQLVMSPALQRMQALVEAFLVVKAPDHVKEQVHTGAAVPSASSSRVSMEVDPAGAGGAAEGSMSPSVRRELGREASMNVATKEFVSFAEKHRQTLNLFIRQDKTLLHSVAYSSLVRFPKLLDFDNKKHYLRSELKKRNAQQRHPSIRLNVRREFVFEDSFHQILPRKPEELKGRLTIVFQGEEGVDAGGLTREWYLTVSKQMLNPDKALFIHSSNGLTYQPNPASTIQPDYLKYFKFAGQLVGKALWDEQLLDAHFTQSMYKHMLNQPIEYTDVESIDPEYFRNLGWMLKNDITDILEETFSIVREQFGEMLTIDLKPNGRNLEVTEENKHEYVQLVAEQQMTRGIKEQIDAFKEGFHQLMPPDLISIFTCSELELLMCGLPSIDIEDLRANTEYTGYTRDSPQISWFWTVVQSMVQEDLARLLQFVTGTSQVPMEGFKALRGMNGPQKFNIHRAGDKNRLPSSHTCFNQLDLPEFTSEEQLRKSLLSAVREGFEGFGFS